MKHTIKNADDLNRAIVDLERKSASQKNDIEETYKSVSENLKPMNIVKNGFRSTFSGDHKGDVVNALIGLGSGFLGRKLIIGKANGIVGKTIGKAIQWGMAGLVSKNADKIKDRAGEIIDKLFKKNKADSNQIAVNRINSVKVKIPKLKSLED